MSQAAPAVPRPIPPQPKSKPRWITRLGFYLATIALVIVVWRIQLRTDRVAFPADQSTVFSSASDAPSQWQQLAIQALSETNQLLTTLATALLGALGLILSREHRRSKPRHLWSAALCALCTGLSLYYAYVIHVRLLWMVTIENFDATSPLYRSPSYCQFYFLLAAVFFFADFAVHDLGHDFGEEI